MLTLDGVTIGLQLCGSVVGVFLTGQHRAIERRFFSFYNYETTGGELEWWSETCGLFWIYSSEHLSAVQKFVRGLQRSALAELLNKADKDEASPEDESMAQAIAEERYKQVESVAWWNELKARKITLYNLGESISAERGTGNFDDDVLSKVVSRSAGTLDLLKGKDGEVDAMPERKEEPFEDEEQLAEQLGPRLAEKHDDDPPIKRGRKKKVAESVPV